MCNLMIKDIDFIRCDSVEADKDHTLETLEYFKMKFPDKKLFMICGIDMYDAFGSKWNKQDVVKVINDFDFIILQRENEDIKNIESHGILLIKHKMFIKFHQIHLILSHQQLYAQN